LVEKNNYLIILYIQHRGKKVRSIEDQKFKRLQTLFKVVNIEVSIFKNK